MDNLMLILIFIFFTCFIAGIIKPSIMIRWGTSEKKTRKNVLKYYGIGLIISISLLELIHQKAATEVKEKATIAQAKKEAEAQKKEAKENEKYAALLDSGKTYEAMTSQERTDISELLQTWEKKNQEFKDKYQSKKEFIEKSMDEAVAKWKSEKEAKDAQVAAQKAEEEKIGYDTGITYDQLARTPDNYKGKKAKFSGKVVQVMEGDGETDLRIAVGGNYDNMLFVAYKSEITSTRILENDQVIISGKSAGIYKYKSTMGGQISVPSMLVDKIELSK